jgi:hypothetical protein
MKSTSKPTVAAMEGGGFYNRNSAMQAAGIARVLPMWGKIASTVPVGDEPIVIADYGSSQGRNSMAPMRIAIAALRAASEPGRTVQVIHTDLPSNDFASLFQALAEEPDSYLNDAAGIFPSAVGRSYFEPIIVPETVHLGWNSWTLQWLSRNPIEVADHIVAGFGANDAAKMAVREQAAQDWRDVMAARACELRPGRPADMGMAIRRAVGSHRRHEGGWSADGGGAQADDTASRRTYARRYQSAFCRGWDVLQNGD